MDADFIAKDDEAVAGEGTLLLPVGANDVNIPPGASGVTFRIVDTYWLLTGSSEHMAFSSPEVQPSMEANGSLGFDAAKAKLPSGARVVVKYRVQPNDASATTEDWWSNIATVTISVRLPQGEPPQHSPLSRGTWMHTDCISPARGPAGPQYRMRFYKTVPECM